MRFATFFVAFMLIALAPASPTAEKRKPARTGTLHILAVGVDRYPGLPNTCRAPDGTHTSPCDLQYAGADARLFVKTMARVIAPLHAKTRVRLLVNGGKDGEPTRVNIVDALDSLHESEPEDTVVIFLAGHGERDGRNRYVFLPTDVQRDGAGRRTNIMDARDIQHPLNNAKGRRFLFVDACNAGALRPGAEDDRVLFFGAAQSLELAEENEKTGHGVFTRAIAEALVTGARRQKDSELYLGKVAEYVGQAVRQATGGRQNPAFSSESFRTYVFAK